MQIKLQCEVCSKVFFRDNGQVNRSLRKNAHIVCSRSCLSSLFVKDLIGKKFTYLTVLKKHKKGDFYNIDKSIKGRINWICKCKCGAIVLVSSRYLIAGYTKSCGCLTLERSYGQTKELSYHSYIAMMGRCNNPKNGKYKDYGGRGIKVCERWTESYKNFKEDMGDRINRKLTLERKDVNGNYEPTNCKWATNKEQSRNKRNNKWLIYKGRKMILQDWAAFFEISQTSLYNKIKRSANFNEVYNYYMVEKENKFICYNGRKMNKSDWARYFNISVSTLSERIKKGQSFETIFNFYKSKNNALFYNSKKKVQR